MSSTPSLHPEHETLLVRESSPNSPHKNSSVGMCCGRLFVFACDMTPFIGASLGFVTQMISEYALQSREGKYAGLALTGISLLAGAGMVITRNCLGGKQVKSLQKELDEIQSSLKAVTIEKEDLQREIQQVKKASELLPSKGDQEQELGKLKQDYEKLETNHKKLQETKQQADEKYKGLLKKAQDSVNDLKKQNEQLTQLLNNFTSKYGEVLKDQRVVEAIQQVKKERHLLSNPSTPSTPKNLVEQSSSTGDQ